MGTAERYGASGAGAATIAEAERGPRVPTHGIPADISVTDMSAMDISAMDVAAEAERVTEAGTAPAAGDGTAPVAGAGTEPFTDTPRAREIGEIEEAGETGADLLPESGDQPAARAGDRGHYRPLWIEEPARRRRLPDPVRTSAVRAVIIIAVTLIQAMVAFLCTMAGSWLAFPMVLSSVASTVVATWGALDVWVTRQVWNQRNGVVSEPSSTARALRRERRRARRQERTAQRANERIRRRSGAGRLSHSS